MTKKGAQSELNKAKKSHKPWRKERRMYECPECGSWHLTSCEEFGVELVKLIDKERWERLLA